MHERWNEKRQKSYLRARVSLSDLLLPARFRKNAQQYPLQLTFLATLHHFHFRQIRFLNHEPKMFPGVVSRRRASSIAKLPSNVSLAAALAGGGGGDSTAAGGLMDGAAAGSEVLEQSIGNLSLHSTGGGEGNAAGGLGTGVKAQTIREEDGIGVVDSDDDDDD